MKGQNAEVRLGIVKSMFNIFESSERSLLISINNFLGTLEKNNKYRIREFVNDILDNFGIKYGLEVFKNNIEGLFFNYLSDKVASVSEFGIKGLSRLILKI